MSKWEMVRLSDIIDEIITGEWGTECADNEVGTKVLRTTNFTNLGVINFDNVILRNISAKKVKKKKLKRNDIILEKSGGSDNQPVGRVVFFENGSDEVFLCNNFTQVLRIRSCVALPRYVFLYLFRLHQNGTTELLQNKTTGIRNLQVKQYMELEIPLPPLEVQRQIADVLDRASALIEKRKAQMDKLDLLVKSQFIEMFGDPVTNPKGWKIGTIRNLVSSVRYGTSRPASEEGRYIYLRMNNITYEGYMDFSSLKYIDIDDKEIEKFIVRKGDVLFNRTNSKELVGKTAVFKEEIPMVIAGYIIRVRANEKAHPEYISAILNSRYGKTTLSDLCRAIVGQANINAQELQDIKIPLTPIDLQNEFANFVCQIEAQKYLLQLSLDKFEQNYQSLMQKCFRGEIF